MTTRKLSQKSKAFALYGTMTTRKEIAQKVGVTEKTLRGWFKEWEQKEALSKQTIENLKRKLDAISLDPNTPVQDIKDLVWCISQLSKTTTNAKAV